LQPPATSPPAIAAILESYRRFEKKVSRVMQGLCAPFCQVCPTPCCRVEICREAFDSPFLRQVHQTTQPFDAKLGYLGCNGCTLTTGRPPICHAFVCDRIMTSQPSDERRYAIDCLGDLVGFLGKRAWRGRHLVEALSDADLGAANIEKFHRQLLTAEAAFLVLHAYLENAQQPSPADLAVLAQIRIPADPAVFHATAVSSPTPARGL
jgi:hypothetical protein